MVGAWRECGGGAACYVGLYACVDIRWWLGLEEYGVVMFSLLNELDKAQI